MSARQLSFAHAPTHAQSGTKADDMRAGISPVGATILSLTDVGTNVSETVTQPPRMRSAVWVSVSVSFVALFSRSPSNSCSNAGVQISRACPGEQRGIHSCTQQLHPPERMPSASLSWASCLKARVVSAALKKYRRGLRQKQPCLPPPWPPPLTTPLGTEQSRCGCLNCLEMMIPCCCRRRPLSRGPASAASMSG